MAHTFRDIEVWQNMYFHVWFVTKYRKAILMGDVEHFVKGIFEECVKRHEYEVLEIETNIDHVHLLVMTDSKASLAKIVQTLKAVSARELFKTQRSCIEHGRHFWARRYGYREIDKSEVAAISEYIRNQKTICVPKNHKSKLLYNKGVVPI